MKKVRLHLEHLSVTSFRTAEGASGDRPGTVHAQVRCTYWNSCVCNTGPYWCGTVQTFSCDYTGALCEP
jgi:hypothetical protein